MRILIVRLGAYGDLVLTSPLIRHLAQQGHEIYYLTSERGIEVLKNNPRIKELIPHKKDSIPTDQLEPYFKKIANKYKCERIIDLCESIEVALSLHPRGPEYNLPKWERKARHERNFYEYTFEFAKESWEGVDLKPELFFYDDEIKKAKSYLRPGFNLLVGMSGSGSNKAWPWTEALVGSIHQTYPDVHVITVGDERCQIIEPQGDHITNLSGKVNMRIAMCLTRYVDCVISPDTGLIHASGCYPTPKICLLGHNTKEVITKYFENDYSVEADPEKAECAPCFRLIYNMALQCPTANLEAGGGAWCMTYGVEPEIVFEKFKQVYCAYKA
jgi:ADP-heptose:LPS heptosyltransferase